MKEAFENVVRNEDCKIYKYTTKRTSEGRVYHILMEGDYLGRHFVILRQDLGFPTAYVELKEDERIDDPDATYDNYDYYVHGGLTYDGRAFWNEEDKRYYIGWDYAHAGDYCAYNEFIPISLCPHSDKKWSLDEILVEIVNLAHQIMVNK